MIEVLYRRVTCPKCDGWGEIPTDDGPEVRDCRACIRGYVYEPIPEPDIERLAAAVHHAYIETCDRLGWSILPANRVPYGALSEASKELDRASARAVLVGSGIGYKEEHHG